MRTLIALLCFLFCNSSFAGELTGFVALDSRVFINAPAFPQQNMGNLPSFVAEPEYYHQSHDYIHTFTFKPFARFDANDAKRSHFDIRQADWLYVQDNWELRAGVSKVFWGVTESNHLVDIINQTDSVEDTDGEDKLGQPMVQLGLFRDWGNLRLFYMPYFRERTFPGTDGRLRGQIPIETDITLYDSPAQRWHPDVAVRYSNIIGNWDIGLSHFSGTSREPNFVLSTNGDGNSVFLPKYEIIDQTGLDLQYTNEGWLLKLEAITRSGQGDRFVAFTSGFEYTFYGVVGSNLDFGLLSEYQFDDRSNVAPATFADNDIFIGGRLTLNDIQDSQLLAGFSFDNNDSSSAIFVEASRRFGNNWKAEADMRLFNNVKYNSPAAGQRRDSHFQLRLARYF